MEDRSDRIKIWLSELIKAWETTRIGSDILWECCDMHYNKKNMVKKTGTQENSAWIRQNTRDKQKTKLRSLRKSESGTSDNTDEIDQSESKKKSKGLINKVIREKIKKDNGAKRS